MYVNVLDKLMKENLEGLDGKVKRMQMAEVIITPDRVTTGFFEDLELIIQLYLDQFTYKMKVLVKSGSKFFNFTSVLGDIGDIINNKIVNLPKRIRGTTYRTFLSLYSYLFQKILLSPLTIPLHLKMIVKFEFNLNRPQNP